MLTKKSVLLSVSLILITPPCAFSHYENDESKAGKHKHHHKVKPKTESEQSANFDPWKLLELALTPAFAAASSVNISRDGYFRIIASNGIPNHSTGAFPNANNPNSISEQHYNYKMVLDPKENNRLTALSLFPFGVAINGIPFDPGANEWYQRDRRSGWQYEAMALEGRLGIDQNNAHVQPNGAYHYHGLPTGLLQKLEAQGKPVLLGYAADGFPIYAPTSFPEKRGARLKSSYRVKSGSRVANSSGVNPGGSYDGSFVQDYEYVKGAGDLDECNGRKAVTAEYPRGTYLYVITDSYPFIPRFFKGTPDESFMRHGQTGRGNRPGGMGGQDRGGGRMDPPARNRVGPPDGPPGGMRPFDGMRPPGGMPPRDGMGPPDGMPPRDGMGPPGGMPPRNGFAPPGDE